MARTPLPPWRSALIERSVDLLRITFRPRSFLFQAALLTAVLTAWACGGLVVFYDVSLHPARRWWDTVWLAVWVAAGIRVFPRFLWEAVGREIVTVTLSRLVLRREILGVGRTRAFTLEQVQDLHYALPPQDEVPPPAGWSPPPPPRLGGSVRFRCDQRLVQFALGIDRRDMALVLEALRDRIHVASTGARERA